MSLRHISGFLSPERANTALEILQACVPWGTFAPSPKSRKVYQWQPGSDDATDFIIQELQHKLEITEKVKILGIF
jgi:hypothetical protein